MSKKQQYQSKTCSARLPAKIWERLDLLVGGSMTVNAFVVRAIEEKLDRLEADQKASADRLSENLKQNQI